MEPTINLSPEVRYLLAFLCMTITILFCGWMLYRTWKSILEERESKDQAKPQDPKNNTSEIKPGDLLDRVEDSQGKGNYGDG